MVDPFWHRSEASRRPPAAHGADGALASIGPLATDPSSADDFFTGSALDREPVVSYAGNWEDVRLRRVTHLLRNRSYIDVGAGDPIVGSVTYDLYLQGWRGLLVDPGSRLATLGSLRSGDIVVSAGVGGPPGEMVFYEAFPDAGMSTFDAARLEELERCGQTWEERRVPLVGLSELWDEQLDTTEVGVLSVDVEGYERQVFESLDSRRHRFEVAVVESIRPWTRESTHEEFEPPLLDAGYRLATFDGVNRFYVAGDHPHFAELVRRLAYPMSVLDRPVHETVVNLRSELEATQVALAQAETRRSWAEAERDALLASTTWRLAHPVARKAARTVEAVRNLEAAGVRLMRRYGGRAGSRRLTHLLPRRLGDLAPSPTFDHPAFAAGPASPRLRSAEEWHDMVATQSRDADEQLLRRLEDREGLRPAAQRQVLAASLAHRVRREGKHGSPPKARRNRVLVDARALQEVGLARRGVGVYAWQALQALRAARGDEAVSLFVDPSSAVPPALAGFDTVSTIPASLRRAVGHLAILSPLTADLWPLSGLLADGSIRSAAFLFDFIPWRYPSCYLRAPEDRLSYEARLASLSLFDDIWAISATTLAEARDLAGVQAGQVVWPDPEGGQDESTSFTVSIPPSYIYLATGAEYRKNVALSVEVCASVAGLTGSGLVIGGWGGPTAVLEHIAADAGLDPREVTVLPRLPAGELRRVQAQARAAVVLSHAEGLSLPVIEAAELGVPVAASDIPAHRELVGPGPWMAPPTDRQALTAALDHVMAQGPAVARTQAENLANHEHSSISETLGAWARVEEAGAQAVRRPKVSALGIITPWPPQPSGVADYSAFTLSGLDGRVPTTWYLSPSAASAPGPQLPARADEPALAGHEMLLAVVGNSHFHLPGLELIELFGGAALCHDVRMAEVNSYLHIDDSSRPMVPASRTTRHALDGLPTLGFSHLAAHCDLLLFHSARAAARVALETGTRTGSLPFIPYRAPTESEREQIEHRQRDRGIRLRLGLLGGVDIRTKAADVAVEVLAWLYEWQVEVTLDIAGAVSHSERKLLEDLAREAGVDHLITWHGRVADSTYRSILCQVDVGLQLRSAELLSLSGAAADHAAFGVPAVVTLPMREDMGLPDFMEAVPADFSPLTVAEAVLRAAEIDPGSTRDLSRQYLETHSVAEYQKRLVEHLGIEAG